MTESVECIVVGAGVLGLAIARRFAMAGQEVVVLEAEDAFGIHTSSRNSEVIHAGIYYAKDSLKARLCVAGKEQLYRYCAENGVGHARLGKLIVATEPDELATLDTLTAKAEGNGVHDLQRLSQTEAQHLEPALRCVGALLSPSTGIVDSHGLMLSYVGDVERHGGAIAYNTPFESARRTDTGYIVKTGGEEAFDLGCRTLINAAGHNTQDVAGRIEGFAQNRIPPRYYCKGTYFTLSGKQPFRHLIYPVPASASLGVHLTVDLAGQARFGPDQEWVDGLDYDLDAGRADAFYDTVRRYYPDLADGAMQPAYTGIRPKTHGPDEPQGDFHIVGPQEHGLPGLVTLFGMESPGLTSSLAIADHVFGQINAG